MAIHGRTRAQGYSGLADWDFIADVKAKSPIPIVGNGDINTAEAAVEKMRVYGVDAVLIGRGALRNPFIFEQAKALWEGKSFTSARARALCRFDFVAEKSASRNLSESQGVDGSRAQVFSLVLGGISGVP